MRVPWLPPSRSARSILFDLSDKGELRPLSDVVRALNDAAQDTSPRWLIVGAAARDLILHGVHGLPIKRFTEDLDVAIAVGTWSEYERLRNALIRDGATASKNHEQRLAFRGWQIDVVPFGGVERDGVIVWPRSETEMSATGLEEASRHALTVLLPGNVVARVASLPALLILKLITWEDRHHELPRHDAHDLRTLIDAYAEEWNRERLYEEGDDLLQHFGYDNQRAAAALLGCDARAIAIPATAARIIEILQRETSDDRFVLAADMYGRVEENLELLRAVLVGFVKPAL